MRCPACEADNPDGAQQCGSCGAKLGRRPRRRSDEEEGLDPLAQRLPYNNPPALYGYRCAVAGIILPGVGLFLGLAALVLGFIGWYRAKTNPEIKGAGHAATAVVLGALEVIVNSAGFVFIWIGLSSLSE